MVKELIHGLVDKDMRVNGYMIKDKVKDNKFLKMVKSNKVIGITMNSFNLQNDLYLDDFKIIFLLYYNKIIRQQYYKTIIL